MTLENSDDNKKIVPISIQELIMDYNAALKGHITDIKIFLDFIDNKRANFKLIEYFKDRKRSLECRFKIDNLK